jgi:hypothetical protein
MLKLDQVDFTWGRASFRDSLPEVSELTAKIFVKICLEGRIDSVFYAQVDTGAAWSILDPLLAEKLGLLSLEGPRTRLSTRFGLLRGTLIRSTVTFLADEGIHLDTSATFFISPDWPPGRTFLGYSGLLDSIRFAVDPQANHFYFGPGV